jgi:membrane-bound lytic murein transglycosylase A
VPAGWADLPNWNNDRHDEAWRAFLGSCGALKRQATWRGVCTAAESANPSAAKAFFERHLAPWRMTGSSSSMVTGYYEPLLTGSRSRRGPNQHPVFAAPPDLLTIDLGDLRPDLKGQRLRGRLEGNRVVPYYDRAAIEAGKAAVTGREILYVDDAVELFFLQIQGSGRVRLDTGETVRLNYADQNGHPFRGVGRILVERGELRLEQASMQGIKAWAQANPAKLPELLNNNPSYVFFREIRLDGDAGPPGALGVPLVAGRSIAADPAFVPLGAPVWLVTTYPNSARPLERLVMAQDTGGAIRGPQRADFFWGFGDEAGREAGRMRQSGELWLLWPAGQQPPVGVPTR